MLDDIKYPEPDPNKRPSSAVWDERYGGESYLFGKEPIVFLKHFHHILKKGKALDIAMGEGRNSVFLASQGFQVLGLDCSKKGVEKAGKLAAEKGVQIEAKSQNLDFYLMPLMHFDTVLMTYFRPLSRFFNEIRRGLVVGGTFMMEAYTVQHYKKFGQNNPLIDFEDCYKPNEVLQHLKMHFHVLYYKEMEEGNAHLVQAIALKAHT